MAVGSSEIGSACAAAGLSIAPKRFATRCLKLGVRRAQFCSCPASSSRMCRSRMAISGPPVRQTPPEANRRGLTSGVIGDANHGRGETVTTMLPADEDYARALLALFAAAGTRPGESIPAGRIGHDFVERNFGRVADYEAALAHAIERGWVKIALDRLRRTPSGFAEF